MTTAVSLEQRETTLWHLVGPGVPDAMTQGGIAIPEVMTAAPTGSGFIARTGRDEFLVSADAAPVGAQALCWVYRRGDCVIALRGAAWRAVMAQVCHMDLSGFGEGGWLMVAAAGINVWCLGLADGVLLGCDPSLGGYFHATLNDVVQQVNETLITETE